MAELGSDPFAMLGLPRRFDLDRSAIERAYLARVAAVHPDMGDLDGPEEASSELNRSRAVLLDPEQRANILLEQLGGPTASENRTLPPDFLARMMQTRLEIEEAIDAGEPEAIARWHEWARAARQDRIDAVGAAFAGLAIPPAKDSLAALRVELNMWRYIERLIEQLPPDPTGRRRTPGAS